MVFSDSHFRWGISYDRKKEVEFTDGDRKIITEENTLVIKKRKVSLADEGRYYCISCIHEGAGLCSEKSHFTLNFITPTSPPTAAPTPDPFTADTPRSTCQVSKIITRIESRFEILKF